MLLFCSDIDNTLIYSYKHEIGSDKVGVERYDGRTISYMTEKSYALLAQVSKRLLFVPTTTRTEEQYNRIAFGIRRPRYALVCNGGVLLEDGRENRNWYDDSYEMTREAADELAEARAYLMHDKNTCFEIRTIRELFLFTKSTRPKETVQELERILNPDTVMVCCQGNKVYAVPRRLSKGHACLRLKEKLKADHMIAAGDSLFDVPMLKAADFAFAPPQLGEAYCLGKRAVCGPGDGIFSDFMLESVLHILDTRGN